MKVERTTHEVIEGKLLNALKEGDKVAIIATEQDLSDLISACEHNQFRGDLRDRCKNLAEGMRQLLESIS